MIAAATTGFLTSFALILAIGAQNAFVLRQGILKQHVFAICLTCAASDALLIGLGVAGFGGLIVLFPNLPIIMRIGGAGFLLVYGGMRFWAAWRGEGHLEAAKSGGSLRAAVLTCLMLTWLNPHVYLDTLGLIGAISTQYQPGILKAAFGVGAIIASFSFFFSLGYGAKLISPYMQSARSWQVLDVGVGILMWVLAAGLILDSGI